VQIAIIVVRGAPRCVRPLRGVAHEERVGAEVARSVRRGVGEVLTVRVADGHAAGVDVVDPGAVRRRVSPENAVGHRWVAAIGVQRAAKGRLVSGEGAVGYGGTVQAGASQGEQAANTPLLVAFVLDQVSGCCPLLGSG
jgi:hypothetical protein